MAVSTAKVLNVKFAIKQSIIDSEYGDIRSILDELLLHPTWDEQVDMSKHLCVHVDGALFDYNRTDGWGYVEEEL